MTNAETAMGMYESRQDCCDTDLPARLFARFGRDR
jgi:hypothetical protein